MNEELIQICKDYGYTGDLKELVDKIWNTAPAYIKEELSPDEVAILYAVQYLELNGYTKKS